MVKNKQNKPVQSKLEFVVLIGPPCSGKSSFTQQPKYKDYFKASIDDLIMALNPGVTYNDAYYNNQCPYCNILYAEKLFKQLFLKAVREAEQNIIIDKTNMSSKARKKILKTVSSERYKKIAVVFDWDMKTLLERNEKRRKETGKFISEKVIREMVSNFVPIQQDESFNKVITVR
jgi:predicted kinase